MHRRQNCLAKNCVEICWGWEWLGTSTWIKVFVCYQNQLPILCSRSEALEHPIGILCTATGNLELFFSIDMNSCNVLPNDPLDAIFWSSDSEKTIPTAGPPRKELDQIGLMLKEFFPTDNNFKLGSDRAGVPSFTIFFCWSDPIKASFFYGDSDVFSQSIRGIPKAKTHTSTLVADWLSAEWTVFFVGNPALNTKAMKGVLARQTQ